MSEGVISKERSGQNLALLFLSIELGKSHLATVVVSKRKSCRIHLKNFKTLLLLSCGRA